MSSCLACNSPRAASLLTAVPQDSKAGQQLLTLLTLSLLLSLQLSNKAEYTSIYSQMFACGTAACTKSDLPTLSIAAHLTCQSNKTGHSGAHVTLLLFTGGTALLYCTKQ